jgi:hypothetical protein
MCSSSRTILRQARRISEWMAPDERPVTGFPVVPSVVANGILAQKPNAFNSNSALRVRSSAMTWT